MMTGRNRISGNGAGRQDGMDGGSAVRVVVADDQAVEIRSHNIQ